MTEPGLPASSASDTNPVDAAPIDATPIDAVPIDAALIDAALIDAVPVDAVLVTPAPGKAPDGLTTICVIAILLSGMGLMGAFGQFINVATGGNLQNPWTSIGTTGMPADVRENQERMMQSMAAAIHRFSAAITVFAVLQCLLSGVMLYGGISSLRQKPRGRDVLFWTLCLSAPFEFARFIPTVMLQFEVAAVMEDFMSHAFAAGGSGSGEATRIGSAVAKVSVLAGVGISAVWVLAKVVFYVVGARYLTRPGVRSLYRSQRIPVAAEFGDSVARVSSSRP